MPGFSHSSFAALNNKDTKFSKSIFHDTVVFQFKHIQFKQDFGFKQIFTLPK